MSAMLDLEEHLKAVVADVIASSFGTNQSDYLKWTNYRDRKVKHHRFSLQGILSTLNGNLLSDKDPIRYYREKYGIVPPWILLKGTYFSTLVNFIHLFKAEQKELLIQKLYGCAPNTKKKKKVKTLFSNTLSICLEYRNLAAHGGRVYNYMSKLNDVITYDPIFDNISPTAKYLSYRYGLSKLLLLLEFFSYQKPLELLKLSVFREINEHLSSFPEDINLLEDIISIKIWYSGTVLISNTNRIFHVNPLCPALKNINFRSIHYTKISSLGYKPCSICSKYFDAKRILKEP